MPVVRLAWSLPPPFNRLACSRRCLATLSSSPDVSRAQLKSRGVLSVFGPEATTFLQGLTTNDISLLHKEQKEHIYTAFLNAQGRVMQDVFIHRDPTTQGDEHIYLIDHDASMTAVLALQIKRYILRAKVKVQDVTEQYRVDAVWPAEEASPWKDNRAPPMGLRMLQPNKQDSRLPEAKEVDESYYHCWRRVHGVPEGPLDIQPGVALPLESCIDWMGGVDFRKGCYVGQELTARTHHTGVVRKRILPVRLSSGEEPNAASELESWNSFAPILDGNISLPQPHIDILRERSEKLPSVSSRPLGKLGSTMLVSDGKGAKPVAIGLALLRLKEALGDFTEESVHTFPSFMAATSANRQPESDPSPAGGLQRAAAGDRSDWRITPSMPPSWWLARLAEEPVSELSDAHQSFFKTHGPPPHEPK